MGRLFVNRLEDEVLYISHGGERLEVTVRQIRIGENGRRQVRLMLVGPRTFDIVRDDAGVKVPPAVLADRAAELAAAAGVGINDNPEVQS